MWRVSQRRGPIETSQVLLRRKGGGIDGVVVQSSEEGVLGDVGALRRQGKAFLTLAQAPSLSEQVQASTKVAAVAAQRTHAFSVPFTYSGMGRDARQRMERQLHAFKLAYEQPLRARLSAVRTQRLESMQQRTRTEREKQRTEEASAPLSRYEERLREVRREYQEFQRDPEAYAARLRSEFTAKGFVDKLNADVLAQLNDPVRLMQAVVRAEDPWSRRELYPYLGESGLFTMDDTEQPLDVWMEDYVEKWGSLGTLSTSSTSTSPSASSSSSYSGGRNDRSTVHVSSVTWRDLVADAEQEESDRPGMGGRRPPPPHGRRGSSPPRVSLSLDDVRSGDDSMEEELGASSPHGFPDFSDELRGDLQPTLTLQDETLPPSMHPLGDESSTKLRASKLEASLLDVLGKSDGTSAEDAAMGPALEARAVLERLLADSEVQDREASSTDPMARLRNAYRDLLSSERDRQAFTSMNESQQQKYREQLISAQGLPANDPVLFQPLMQGEGAEGGTEGAGQPAAGEAELDSDRVDRLSLLTTAERWGRNAERMFYKMRDIRRQLADHGFEVEPWREEEAYQRFFFAPAEGVASSTVQPTKADYTPRLKLRDSAAQAASGGQSLSSILASSFSTTPATEEAHETKMQEEEEGDRSAAHYENADARSRVDYGRLGGLLAPPSHPVRPVGNDSGERYYVQFSSSYTTDPDVVLGPKAQREFRTRRVVLRVQLKALGLPKRALGRLQDLVGSRYDSETGVLRLSADKYPTKRDNVIYLKKLMAAILEDALLADPNYVALADNLLDIEPRSPNPPPSPVVRGYIMFQFAPLAYPHPATLQFRSSLFQSFLSSGPSA